jgi:hypothetical protein
MSRIKNSEIGKYGPTKAYSIRNMPVKFKDRLREIAAHETRINRDKGGDIMTMEVLAIELIAEGLKRREARKRGQQ